VTKLVNNMIAVSNLFMICEALNIGRTYGLDVPSLVALMDAGGGRSFFTEDWEQSRYNFSLFCENSDSIKTIVDICHKDIKHASTLAALMKIDAPFLRGVNATMDALSYDAVLPNWRSVL
jgi:3-hydroxyisobutyrate dehydrogenase-like beta-hydroxyacid dehydrogenase